MADVSALLAQYLSVKSQVNYNQLQSTKWAGLHEAMSAKLSRQTKLPLIIHSRDADKDMVDILENEIKNGEFNFLLHCFSSGKELAYKGLDLGGYISFSGILTFKNAIELQNIAKNIPLDRVLVETDSPYLAPVPHRGKTNQPAYTKNVLEFLSNLLNKDINEVADITTKNCFTLFKYKNYLEF